jgi:hypothetical protein
MRLVVSETAGRTTTEVIEISGEDLHRIIEKVLNCNIRHADFMIKMSTNDGVEYIPITHLYPLTMVATTIEGERERDGDTDIEFIIIP